MNRFLKLKTGYDFYIVAAYVESINTHDYIDVVQYGKTFAKQFVVPNLSISINVKCGRYF